MRESIQVAVGPSDRSRQYAAANVCEHAKGITLGLGVLDSAMVSWMGCVRGDK